MQTLSIRYYSGFLFGLALIALLNGLLLLFGGQESQTVLHKIGFISGTFTFVMFFMFSKYFPISTARPNSRDILFWVIPITFFIPFILFNQQFIQSVIIENGISKPTFGVWYTPFMLVLATFVLGAIYNLIQKYKITTELEIRKNIRDITAVFFVSGLLGFLLDVVLPRFNVYTAHYFAIESSLFVALTTAIIIAKK
ncbi:MAG: hypothetical protein H6760_01300 [Candidatus Nomurabacteria bacterium]|nr:MAG: hypothetical protein H6760_01300 [Candidatus Nomurabacteria bacterium]